jgi:hypothetical protein
MDMTRLLSDPVAEANQAERRAEEQEREAEIEDVHDLDGSHRRIKRA